MQLRVFSRSYDRVVAGIADDSVRQELHQEKEKGLTLKTCIDLYRVHEVSAQLAKTMVTEEIHHVRANSKGREAGSASCRSRIENSDG